MTRLTIQMRPNPRDARKFLRFTAQQRASRAAEPLRRLKGHRGLGPDGIRRAPLRFKLIAFLVTAAAEGEGDNVSVAVEVAPLARFTVEGCKEQE